MVRRAFGILIATAIASAVMGFVLFEWRGIARAATGVVRIVERKLPDAEIRVTGIGHPPRRRVTPSQKRLLAQRAATVEAYRVLAATLNGISGYVVGGSGYIQVSGYIKGATVTQVREFPDGKVEMDLSLPVSLIGKGGGDKITWDKVIADINRKGYPVYYLRKPEKEISEEEWLEMIEKKEGGL